MKIIKLLIILLYSLNAFSGNIPEVLDSIHSKFSGKAYIISIGVDNYNDSNFDLKYCQSDADYFLKSISRDTSIRELKKYIFRNNSTKDQVKAAFTEVEKIATKNDLFIFYYSGMSNGIVLKLTNENISFEEVFVLSQNIFSERQIYISDASDGSQFGISFRDFLKKKPLEKISTKINRVLISLKTDSYELSAGPNLKDSDFAGGQLTGSLSNSKFKISTIFNKLNQTDKFWTEFKHDIYQTYDIQFPLPDISIFSEQDYLSEIKKEVKRGIVFSKIEEESVDKTIIKKGETLCILVGNQNFEKLNRLPNVMNDVLEIEKTLKNMYESNIILLKDIDYKTFVDTLIYIKEKYKFEEGSQLLFFSASHGLKDKFGLGYLCFTNTKINDNMATSFELQTLKRCISNFGATNTLMIMDICHSGLAFEENNCNNPSAQEISLKNPLFTSSFNENSPAYKNLFNQTSNLYFGSSRDQEAADGRGANSPFATALISFLNNNNLPVIDSYHLQKSILNNKVIKEEAISFPTFCSYNCKPDGRFLFIRK
jgi:hypothetical protein